MTEVDNKSGEESKGLFCHECGAKIDIEGVGTHGAGRIASFKRVLGFFGMAMLFIVTLPLLVLSLVFRLAALAVALFIHFFNVFWGIIIASTVHGEMNYGEIKAWIMIDLGHECEVNYCLLDGYTQSMKYDVKWAVKEKPFLKRLKMVFTETGDLDVVLLFMLHLILTTCVVLLAAMFLTYIGTRGSG